MNAVASLATAFQDEVPNFRPSGTTSSSIGILFNRVRAYNPRSPWAHEIEDKLNHLTALPRGWDGYNGRPVSYTCAKFAANLMESLFVGGVPAPQMVPGAGGTIQLEWHLNKYDVEVEVLGTYNVVASRYDHMTGQMEEEELQTDFTTLACWVRELRKVR